VDDATNGLKMLDDAIVELTNIIKRYDQACRPWADSIAEPDCDCHIDNCDCPSLPPTEA